MNKQHLYGLINPFERIAGLEALLWGLAGMVVSTALSFYSGWHYHGLLHLVRLRIRRGGVMRWSTLPSG